MERYTADQIQAITFEEHVRARPAMYFRVARESPELPTEILQQVVWDALHHRDGTHGQISVEIESDLAFSVEDDQRRTGDERGRPVPGFFGSLVDKERWAPAAAAVLSVRTVVEVRLNGRGFRQELAGAVSAGDWDEFATSKLRYTDHIPAGPVVLRPRRGHRLVIAPGGTARPGMRRESFAGDLLYS
ncbi:hypothetical protein ACIP2X_08215 [Streptomyces sp. NPDC089424]|uniref:hypothetical protein n=1 Tax=Streptomyces sp. NPDC089424 TaxID=3365917 RepID=UPI003824803B